MRGSRRPALRLPVPPSQNHGWRQARGRTVLSGTMRAWRAAAVPVIQAWAAATGWQAPDPDQVVRVRLSVQWPNWAVRDPDNVIKPVLDALVTAGVLADDRWALPAVVAVAVDPADPGVRVRLVRGGRMIPPRRRRPGRKAVRADGAS